jgi:hypothetical protein
MGPAPGSTYHPWVAALAAYLPTRIQHYVSGETGVVQRG